MIHERKKSRIKPLPPGEKPMKRPGDKTRPGKSINKFKQKAFLASYVKHRGNKCRAAKDCGINLDTMWKWFRRDPVFRAEAETVLETFYDELWTALVDRGIEKSDIAAMFLLKERYPEKFDDNVRKAVYLQKNQIADPDKAAPTQIVFVREPERQSNEVSKLDEPQE